MPDSHASTPSQRLRRLFPFLAWWHLVTPSTFRADFMAGLTGAVVVLPQGVAFATIAGMPPVYGLYAGMVPAIVAALFGSSWHLVSGPTTAASIVLYSMLSIQAEPGSAQYVQLALTMAFLVGLFQLGLGLARLGVLVNYISHSVVMGFTSGAALLIASNQLKYFFGVQIPKGSDFTHTLTSFFQHITLINPYVLLVSCATLVTGILIRRFFPRFPYMIAALLVGSLLAFVLKLLVKGETGITTMDAIPGSLPPLSMPDFSPSTLHMLAPGVVAITILALTEAISIARALALRSGQNLDSNQEFIAQGLSNMVGGFFSAYVATGSFNRSGLNYDSGAKTPLAAAFSGILLIGLVMLVAPLSAYLPHAAMAGVLFLVAWGLIDFHHIGQIIHTSKAETIILVATFLATLLLNLELAILLGVMLSLGVYLNRTSHPQVIERIPDVHHPSRKFITRGALAPACPQIQLIRIDGSLFYAAAQHVIDRISAASPEEQKRHLIIIATGVNFIDISGADLLIREAEKRRASGAGLYFIRIKKSPRSFLKKGGYIDKIGEENLFNSKSEALRKVIAKIDKKICATCPYNVFVECAEQKSHDPNTSNDPVQLISPTPPGQTQTD
ncbi:MAG: SulP family inorganic anion transporter [Magnetococcales bacterium]|nr:SulP family inorganic anion transporter [Magnetococcales bacterium]